MNSFSTIRNLALSLISGFLGFASIAQPPDCRPEDAQLVATQWVRKPDALVGAGADFPKKSFPMVFERQEKLLKLLQKAYPNPKGIEARAYRVVKSDPDNAYQRMPAGSPLLYSVTTYYLHYWCFKGKPERSVETGTWIECYVNSLWQFMEPLSRDEYLLPNGQQMYYMPQVIGELKGYPIYSTKTDLPDNRRESILILKDHRLPVRAVSREELVRSLQRYVQNYVKENDETTRKLEAGLKESLAYADQLAFKSPVEREKYKEDNRQSVENGRIKRDQIAQKYRENSQRLEAMLAKMTPQERAAQAVISDPYGFLNNSRGKGTFEEQAVNGRPLVTHDLQFADPRLPRHAIQSIQLLLKYETHPSMAAKLDLMRQFRQNIDLDGLKALLDRN